MNIKFEDGIIRNCEWHMKYTPGCGRIHFSADHSDGRTIYIGYVDKKIGIHWNEKCHFTHSTDHFMQRPIYSFLYFLIDYTFATSNSGNWDYVVNNQIDWEWKCRKQYPCKSRLIRSPSQVFADSARINKERWVSDWFILYLFVLYVYANPIPWIFLFVKTIYNQASNFIAFV